MLKLRAAVVAVVSVCAMALVVGCGGSVSEADVEAASARIDALKTKGLPDDSTAIAKAKITQARLDLKKNNKAGAKVAYDTAIVHLERAEKFYNEHVSTLGPTIDAAVKQARDAKENMTGHQVKKIDSIVAVIDSLRKMDWLFLANTRAQELVALLPSLKEDEAKSVRIRQLVPGEWEYVDHIKSVEHKEVKGVEKKILRFCRDNKVEVVETKFGRTAQFLKEDWEFRSYGTYDFRGDTIMIAVSRFNTVRQNFETGIPNEKGGIDWKKDKHPTSDLQITDGSQDRTIVFSTDLEGELADFRRTKRGPIACTMK